jgi:hypothetical protein
VKEPTTQVFWCAFLSPNFRRLSETRPDRSFSDHDRVALLDVSVFRASNGGENVCKRSSREKTLHDPCRTVVFVENEGKPKIVRDLRGKLARGVNHSVRGRSFSFGNTVLLLDTAHA